MRREHKKTRNHDLEEIRKARESARSAITLAENEISEKIELKNNLDVSLQERRKAVEAEFVTFKQLKESEITKLNQEIYSKRTTLNNLALSIETFSKDNKVLETENEILKNENKDTIEIKASLLVAIEALKKQREALGVDLKNLLASFFEENNKLKVIQEKIIRLDQDKKAREDLLLSEQAVKKSRIESLRRVSRRPVYN